MLRPRPTYANVVATLALFVALGGSSYAATTLITGKQVKDGSLTGKDIKAKSVPLNRLRGKLKAGPRGPQGERGPTGATGAAGAAGAAGPTGEVRVTAPPQIWTTEPGGVYSRSATADATYYTRAAGTSDENVNVQGYPTLPVTVGGKSLRWKGVQYCYDDSNANVAITSVRLLQIRQTLGPDSSEPLPVDVTVPQTLNNAGCSTVNLPAPVAVAPTDYVRIAVRLHFTGTGFAQAGLGRATYIFDAAP